ncbi:MAG: SDR family NAD(P)-dependent oxidoreductase [Polyangiaceae bacterium]|nr:SDR family NAD(P)-dependent oxidoreductase [Polyangiaceae bacterium]
MPQAVNDLSRWKGRVALVTGASSGIGRAVAERLAQAGMKVAVAARRTERLEPLRASGDVLPLGVDLRREADIEEMFAQIRKRWDGVDVLVNNAGLGHRAPLCSGSTEHWREMLEVNVLALCICTREAVRDMRRRGDAGHVIHVSSMAAHRVPGDSGVYSATKFAVRALTEGLRQELRADKSKIRVSAISPGFVETEFAAHYHKSEQAAAETYGRYQVLSAQDMADTVAWVLGAPDHMQVHDVLIRPRDQTS